MWSSFKTVCSGFSNVNCDVKEKWLIPHFVTLLVALPLMSSWWLLRAWSSFRSKQSYIFGGKERSLVDVMHYYFTWYCILVLLSARQLFWFFFFFPFFLLFFLVRNHVWSCMNPRDCYMLLGNNALALSFLKFLVNPCACELRCLLCFRLTQSDIFISLWEK